jgi:Limiting CO2-inducible proteins B/C beta carbonyic anhydrases
MDQERTLSFNATLDRDFPGAIPANQFVSSTQNALKEYGVHRGSALPLIATCRDELAFALTAELQRAWGPAFNMAGLAGLLTLGRTGIAAARGHAPIVSGRRTFVLFGLTHVGVDDAGTIGSCERPGVPGPSKTCGALMALHDALRGGDAHTSDYPYLDPADPEQSRLRERITPLVADPLNVDLLAITRIARDLIDQDADTVAQVLRDDDIPADIAVFTGIHIHGPRGAEYVELGRCFFDQGSEITQLSLTAPALTA